MTAKELASALLALPAEQQNLPVYYIDEVWLHHVQEVRVRHSNEYGLDPEAGHHIRLDGRHL